MEKNETFEIKSVRLPAAVWRAIEADAERCRRSVPRQIEAVFSVYYGLDPDIDIGPRRPLVSQGDNDALPPPVTDAAFHQSPWASDPQAPKGKRRNGKQSADVRKDLADVVAATKEREKQKGR